MRIGSAEERDNHYKFRAAGMRDGFPSPSVRNDTLIIDVCVCIGLRGCVCVWVCVCMCVCVCVCVTEI